VATGHVEYHPLYLSIGLVHNTVRRGHRNAVIPIAFLAIPKGMFDDSTMSGLSKQGYLTCLQADRKYDDDLAFRKFKRQMYHDSIAAILSPLKTSMLHPVIRRCPDGHFHRVIYDLAAYIADYPEQVYLAGVVQNWCLKYNHFLIIWRIQLILYLIDVQRCIIISMAKGVVNPMSTLGDLWKSSIRSCYGTNMGLTMTS